MADVRVRIKSIGDIKPTQYGSMIKLNCLSLETMEDRWITCFMKANEAFPFKAGQELMMEITTKRNGQYTNHSTNLSKITPVENLAEDVVEETVSLPSPKTPKAPDWDAKERRIVRQSCLKVGAELVGYFISQERIVEIEDSSGKKKKVKPSALGEDSLMQMAIKVAEQAENWVYTDRDLMTDVKDIMDGAEIGGEVVDLAPAGDEEIPF